MAEIYGSVVQGSHDNFDITGGKAKLTYTITNNPISVDVTYSLAFVATASRQVPSKRTLSTSVNVSGNVYGDTGSGTLSFSLYNPGTSPKTVSSTKSITLVSNKKATFIKGTSARTFAIGFSATMSYGSTAHTSSGSLTVSVPARESYPVTYNANGGASAPTSQTKYRDIELTLKNDKPSLSGYTFKGWSISQERANHKDSNQQPDQIDYASGGSYTGNAALALYAAWEKDYIKPIITNVKLERCKANGSLDDEGTYARLLFDWAIDTTKHAGNTVDSLTVTVGTITEELSVTGASGSYGDDNPVIIGNGSFNTDTQYPATITLADTCIEADPTSWTGTLGLAYFPLDISANGDSIALGMPAPDNTHGIYLGDDVHVYGNVDLASGAEYRINGKSITSQPIKVVRYGWVVSPAFSERTLLISNASPSNSSNPSDEPSSSEYTFFCWVSFTTSGWVGGIYPAQQLSRTTNIWTASSKAKTTGISVYGVALYVRNDLL